MNLSENSEKVGVWRRYAPPIPRLPPAPLTYFITAGK